VRALLCTSIASVGLTCLAFAASHLVVISGILRAGDGVTRYGLIVLVVLGVVCSGAYAVAVWLGDAVAAPLRALSLTASRVSAERDYSARATRHGTDELGQLIDRFNEMLADVHDQQGALRASHHALERRLDERTRALRTTLAALRATEQELVSARDALEGAARTKQTFLATMSHELRTPLHAIIGYGEMLEAEAAERGYAAALPDLRKVITAGRLTLGLLDDILAVSQVEAGRTEFIRETFQPSNVLTDAVAAVRPSLERRGYTIALDLTSELGDAWGDPVRVRQALLSLLSNVSGFAERGRVAVGARRIRSDRQDHCDWLEVTIVDSGCALPHDFVAHFNEVSSAEGLPTRTLGASELGLVISQRLSQLMGGRITVTGEPGAGSTFTVMLPVSGGSRDLTQERVSSAALS
jgi:signal transduction histidine kinase